MAAPLHGRDRKLNDSEVNGIYLTVQDALRVESGEPFEIEGPTSALAVRPKLHRGNALAHPDDIRAVLRCALNALVAQRSKRPEFRYLQMALRRHLEFDVSLDQAFGYAQIGKGAPPLSPERARRIACAVFEERFLRGSKPDVAAYKAGKKFGVRKTQALAAFAAHDAHALDFWKTKRKTAPYWKPAEEERLTRYYVRRQQQVKKLLGQPEK